MSLVLGAKLRSEITDIAFGGEGVARVEQFVAFVPFTAPGEVVEFEVTESKKRFARGRLLEVIEASPERVEPPCPYFGVCGGCQYQHLSYPAQLKIKHKQIADHSQRIGGLSPDTVAPVVECPRPYGYRNRIMLRSQWDKFKKGLNLGYLRADSRLVVDVEECKIAEPALNEKLRDLRAHPPPKGGLKVVLRIPPEGWRVPPDSFFQNNFFLLPKLVETVRERFRSGGCQSLVDVYCGVGFFSLELADLAQSCVGIEYDRLAIKAAQQNARERGRQNCEFRTGRAEELLADLLSAARAESTCVLLDPPRKGCQREVLELLRRTRPAQLIYVSCQPATMARDLNVLSAGNVFKVAQVAPLDMFPQTMHVECVADIRCNSSGAESAPKRPEPA